MYLKSIFLNSADLSHARSKVIHPPIDRVLLGGLARTETDITQRRKWNEYKNKGWSNFNSDDYQTVIDDVRAMFADQPLWN